jgi:hypothetical protein
MIDVDNCSVSHRMLAQSYIGALGGTFELLNRVHARDYHILPSSVRLCATKAREPHCSPSDRGVRRLQCLPREKIYLR